MSSATLYRKYRPQTFADVVGQKPIVRTLTNALRMGRVGQAYLFTGPRGTGKTTLARLFAKAVNCSKRKGSEPCGKCEHCLLMAEGRSLDIIEIDAASHTGVDNIRELRETIGLPPTLGSHKVYIIDEVHMLSMGAFNALLKTLEEPPAHVLFILATTALHKVPDTIVSRCQRFDLSRFPVQAIVAKLAMIAANEKMRIEKPALEMIALAAEGGMRDAESLLMQIASLETSPITEDTVIEVLGTTKRENLIRLLRLIAQDELFPALAFVRELSRDGADLAVFASALLHTLRDLLLVSADPVNGPAALDHLTDEQTAALLELAKTFPPERIVLMLELFQIAQRDSKTAVIPELPLEIAIVKLLADRHPHPADHTPPTTSDPPVPPAAPVRIASTKPAPSVSASPAPLSSADPKSSGEAREAVASIDLSVVQENWRGILATAKRLNASLTLALSTARPLATEGDTITLAVKYPFHKERLDTPANRLTLKQAFDSILNTPVRLNIVLESASATPAIQTDPASGMNEAPLDPLVTQALELLGGTLVNES